MMKKGFTLIEVLIVTAVIGLLTVAVTFSVGKQRTKAEDAGIKTDLARLKIAFEDYYNDHNCYPPSGWFNGPEDVGSGNLIPYLDKIPFNKKTNLPYILEKDATGCNWFKIYATLNNTNDPAAVSLRSPTGSKLGNYGVSSSNTVVSVFYDPAGVSPTATPAPSVDPGKPYYCSAVQNCSSFDTNRFSCGPAYADPNCTGSGGCAEIGSCTPL